MLLDLNETPSQEEISKRVSNGENVITFDFRGAGKDRMKYLTESSDNIKFDNADSITAYVNPLAGVMANYVYNSVLLGRPYFLEMIEDVEIATTFAREQLGIKEITVAGNQNTQLLLQQVAKTIPGIKLENNINIKPVLSWPQIVNEKREIWPIQYLLPGGAYIR
jgi:hypothetical protein